MITNVKKVGSGSVESYNPTDTSYSWSDGTTSKSGTSRTATVLVNNGGGIEFNLTGSDTERYVHVYTGAWASDVTFEVSVNGEVEYTKSYSQPKPADKGLSKTFSMKYQTEKNSDVVHVKAYITKTYSSGTYTGNMSFQAITVSDHEPVSKDDKISTPEWEVNISNGMITSMKSLIGDDMYNIPMRRDAEGGMSWTWNGESIPITSVEKDEVGTVYIGTYQKHGVDLTFKIRYSVDEHKSFVTKVSLTNNGIETLNPKKASINLGVDTYLDSWPSYNDKFFPTLLRCEETHMWGYFTTPSGRIMTVTTDQPVASYTLNYESGAHRIRSATLDMLHEGPLPNVIHKMLIISMAEKQKSGILH